ncbi:MAG: NgoFVII family restriction endonuclease [Elusimicrobiota bacterium]|nr:NgoFVII family restriction endonuclease [Elusimicrobiota bacterium]
MEPIKQGATGLYIVSGFATPTMVTRHMIDIKDKLKIKGFKINLLVGMVPRCDMGIKSHENFKILTKNEYNINFSCSYVYNIFPVHSKLYIFSKNYKPIKAFIGSANYTQTGFGDKQLEIINDCNPVNAMRYFNKIEKNTIICTHPDVKEYVNIIKEERYRKHVDITDKEAGKNVKRGAIVSKDKVTFPLKVGYHSGLNWGQREGRNPNQAYISLPASVYKTDFFPPRKEVFTIWTDDNKSIICVRAQDNGKAIHSTSNNALLGEYFRNRLKVPDGQRVRQEDLERYGRVDVTFLKIDDETYFMDFSVK